jgi:hypothetical protein
MSSYYDCLQPMHPQQVPLQPASDAASSSPHSSSTPTDDSSTYQSEYIYDHLSWERWTDAPIPATCTEPYASANHMAASDNYTSRFDDTGGLMQGHHSWRAEVSDLLLNVKSEVHLCGTAHEQQMSSQMMPGYANDWWGSACSTSSASPVSHNTSQVTDFSNNSGVVPSSPGPFVERALLQNNPTGSAADLGSYRNMSFSDMSSGKGQAKSTKKKRHLYRSRAGYRCSKCGQLKKAHICPVTEDDLNPAISKLANSYENGAQSSNEPADAQWCMSIQAACQ